MSARVYLARWVLPISSPPIADGAVAVEGERIAFVGPRAHAPEGERIDLGEAIMLPGLVNAHTHLELTAFRGLLNDLPFRRWILRLTRARDAVMNAEGHLAAARLGIAEGLLRGITTYGDCTAAGHSLAAMRDMGVRGVVYQEVFGPDAASAGTAMAALTAAVESHRALGVRHVTVGVSPHAPYTVSDPLFRDVARFAETHGLPLAVHVAESEAESALVEAAIGEFADGLRARGIGVSPRATSPVALLESLGVLGRRTLLIHAIRLTQIDIATIARCGSAVAHCPASNAKLGHGIAPLTDLLAAGVAVGLGSDSVASNDQMDLVAEARLAALLQRSRTGRHDAIGAAAALRLATLGGAQALGLAEQAGTLEPGKAADLAAFPLDQLGDEGGDGPADALVHGAAGRRACLTVVAGAELVRQGQLVADVADDRRVVAESARALRTYITERASAD